MVAHTLAAMHWMVGYYSLWDAMCSDDVIVWCSGSGSYFRGYALLDGYVEMHSFNSVLLYLSVRVLLICNRNANTINCYINNHDMHII